MTNLDLIVVGCPSQENYYYPNENPPESIPHIRNTPLKAHQHTLIPPTVKNIFQSIQSPSGPVYTKKNDFRIYKTV